MAKPGLEQQIKVIAHYLGWRRARRHQRSRDRKQHPRYRRCDFRRDGERRSRIGEATMLVRYEGKFGTVPVTVLNPEAGLCLEAAAAK